jgi:hypothetical protein
MEYEPEKQSLSQNRCVFLGAYDQGQGELGFSLDPSARGTASGRGRSLGMGLEQRRFYLTWALSPTALQ